MSLGYGESHYIAEKKESAPTTSTWGFLVTGQGEIESLIKPALVWDWEKHNLSPNCMGQEAKFTYNSLIYPFLPPPAPDPEGRVRWSVWAAHHL